MKMTVYHTERNTKDIKILQKNILENQYASKY